MTDTVALSRTCRCSSSLDRQAARGARERLHRADVPAPARSSIREGDTHGIGFFVVADGEGVVTVGGKQVDTDRAGQLLRRGGAHQRPDADRDRDRHAPTCDCLVMTFWDFRAFVKGDADVAWKLLEHVGGMLHGRS